MKRKYSTGKTQQDVDALEKETTKEALSKPDVKATLLSPAPRNAKERSKQEDSNSIKDNEEAPAASSSSEFKSFLTKSVDEQRREELQLLMKDRSLSRDEKSKRMEEVKARYQAAAAVKPGSCPPPPIDVKKNSPSHSFGNSAALDEQRRRELLCIMKNRNIDRDTKNKLLEEVKVRYDILNNEEAKNQQVEKASSNEEANDSQDATLSPKNEATEANALDVSAESFSQKHLRELEVIRDKAAKAKSIKDRMSAFKNDTTVNYDPVAFAVSQNKSNSGKNMPSIAINRSCSFILLIHKCFSLKAFKARQNAKQAIVESAKNYNYQYGGVVDETSAEFKAMGNGAKAAKKESQEAAKRYNYKYTG